MNAQTRTDKAENATNTSNAKDASAKRRNADRRRTDDFDEGSRIRADSGSGSRANPHPLLQLQQGRGNRAVQRAVNERIQPKLEVGGWDDKYERETDGVAEQGTRALDSGIGENPNKGRVNTRVQRLCTRYQERFLQGDAIKGTGREATPRPTEVRQEELSAKNGVKSQIQPSTVTGRPLPESVRSTFEPRFGHGFENVGVHTDTKVDDAARAMNVEAFTDDRYIAFQSGAYSPRTIEGQQLLTYEQTHTIQQTNGTMQLQRQLVSEVETPSLTGQDYEVIGSYDAGPVQLEGGEIVSEVSRPVEPTRLITVALNPPYRQAGVPFSIPVDYLRPLGTREEESNVEEQFSEEELAEAGLIATGQVLQSAVASEAQTLRDMYNRGAARIAAERERLRALGQSEEAIARRLSQMRHELAENVRKAGSTLLRKGAEVFDRVRGNVGRPTYETLRSTGKTNGQIIESASRTNKFINRLPTGLRWAGRGLWVASAGISLYVVLAAPEGERLNVAQEELERFAGGVGGAALFEGLCIVVGIATEGLGLVACGLVGGLAGYELASETDLFQMLDIAPHSAPQFAGQIYRIEGDFDVTDLLIFTIVHRHVSASEGVLVVATGQRSGQMMSGRGHYRALEVVPANDAAVRLFEGHESQWVPQYLLHSASEADLLRD